MKKFNVTGMSCAACSARVEKAVSKVKGVTSCSVNLLTGSMVVDGTANENDIIAAVENAGYEASVEGENKNTENKSEKAENREVKTLLKRLFWSAGFLIILMYFSMGHTMWGFPLPAFFNENYVAISIVQLLLSAIVMIINGKFFTNGFKSALKLSPNMDTLVAMGSSVSFIYSVWELLKMTSTQVNFGSAAAHTHLHNLYFETAAMIVTLITVGKTLEAYSKGKTTNAVKSLMDLRPKTANVIIDGVEKNIPASQVKIGDIFVVRPGESFPVDGVIENGSAAVDESCLTGESIPADKVSGDSVFAGTVNISGFLKCKAESVGEETTLSKIIQMVNDAAATKAPIAKIADKVSSVFVPSVIITALLTFIVWLIIGVPFSEAISHGVAVLVISCPCALGLATPVAVMVGSGVGAKNGILFKTSASIEATGKIKTVVLDKTGTITRGKPEVTDILPANAKNSEELLKYAFSLEINSEHPLSKAITEYAKENNIKSDAVTDFVAHSGSGVSGKLNSDMLYGGNYIFTEKFCKIEEKYKKIGQEFAKSGKTPLYFCKNSELLGIIAVADTLKSDSKEAIKELKKMSLSVVMLTGDNEITANSIAKEIDVDKVIAGVLPDKKEAVISELKKNSKVLMVGDGINDAPAMTSADVGMAIGAGTDIAIEAADTVLISDNIMGVANAIKIGRSTIKNIKENLFWAFIYNIIGIPLAAGVFINITGWSLNPMFGAAAMSLSSFCVVSNALRLNFIKLKKSDKKSEKNINKKSKEKTKMEKTLKIEGMMCEHCEARVKKTLESIDGVISADVKHKENRATVTLSHDVSYETLKNAVEEQGYTVL